ncbi:hypothetical protein [Paraprevotella clara]|uniref:Uncharacterized protein n=1 Tax=Paraprevotella clara YIT 11840 TaxID=762968 RepID=G5SUW3_9BACT|nr:hypothetical protein [Paraprevotella clara]EHG99030.1 hypothetical protein HMPREF9441_03178 [Paraprevotella clara YIT 11840]
MRKNIWIIVSGLVCFSACRSVQAPQLIGGNKDEHGCLTAAGYTWSELRRDCIRIFEDGVRVDDPSLQPSLTSYAVFAADSSRVEVFRPSPFRNEILDRKGGVWQGKTCKLYRTGDRWELRER